TTVELRTGPAADEALSAWMQRPVRLVNSDDVEQVSYEMTFDPPDDSAEFYEIPAPPGRLVDLADLHHVTVATLAHVAASRPGIDTDARRFRPNLVLDLDAEPFEEDTWGTRRIEVGEAVLEVTQPT